MKGVRGLWIVLVTIGGLIALAVGVPFWLTAAAVACASLPAILGMILRGSLTATQLAEIEVALWIVLATMGSALTGGASSPLVIGFVNAFAVAWFSGRTKLAVEAAVFSIAGYVLALMASTGARIASPESLERLAACLAVADLVLLAVMAWLGAEGGPTALAPKPVNAGTTEESVLRLKLKQAEERLREARSDARMAQAAAQDMSGALERRTRVFAQTSHELRTPLNAIIGFADMMRSEIYGPLPEKYLEYAGLIHQGGRDLQLVVDGVLDLSRLEAVGADIHPEPMSLNDIAAEATTFMSEAAVRKNIDLRFDDAEDVEAFVDRQAVRQIALNLISNALKFTPEGGEVIVTAFEKPDGAWLAVSDSGVGMTPQELLRLSQAFQQGDAGKKQKGAGLGLSVVRAFAEAHGGRLEIESREGGGSTLAVFFPISQGSGSQAPATQVGEG